MEQQRNRGVRVQPSLMIVASSFDWPSKLAKMVSIDLASILLPAGSCAHPKQTRTKVTTIKGKIFMR
jgi:hypothetical protein